MSATATTSNVQTNSKAPNVATIAKASAPAPTSPKAKGTKKKGSVRKDIGMLMFLLAAETAVVSTISDSSSATAALAAAAATDATAKKGMTFTSNANSAPESDTASSNSRNNGETDSSEEEEEERTAPTKEEVLAKLGKSTATKLVVMDDNIMSNVLSFVPWKEVAGLRSVNRAWLHATEKIVQIRALPGTTTTAAFVVCPKNLDADKDTETALQFLHPSTWRCVVCGFWNAETRVLCGNRQCQCPSLTHAGCARIFLGQLRRDATVPFIQWLVTRVLEAPSDLRNVENHRHNVTNRGKGCAWAYFKTDAVAQELLAYHRRMFLDVVDGDEGVWIVKENEIDVLNEVASERGYTANRPKCLPRNALVVEPPATGSSQMGRELLLSNLNVQCQYAEAEGPAGPQSQTPPPPAVPEPKSRARSNSVTSTTASTTASEYRHNPYSYSPISTSVPSYSWANDNVSTGGNCDTESNCSALPSASSVSAPPGYSESAFMTTAPYPYSSSHYPSTGKYNNSRANGNYHARQTTTTTTAGPYSSGSGYNSTYYSSGNGSTHYSYDSTSYSYY